MAVRGTGLAPLLQTMAHMASILCRGRYEVLKAGVHGAALGLAAVCAAYNLSTWLARHERHSWINAVIYGTLTAWEIQHVRHHLSGRIVGSDTTAGERAA